ncbi:MAG: ClbS/DfsB family four-helix bundle protein [Anaerolineales bacterium]
MDAMLPRDTNELLDVIEKEWQALMETVHRLTPEQMTTPDAGGWSPKDNLAHLAAWMRFMKDSSLNKMPAAQALDIDPEEHKQMDENAENAVLFERNRHRPLLDVLEGLNITYVDVVDTLRSTPFSDLMKPLHESGPDKRLVIESVLGNTSEHFAEHRKTIEAAYS